MRSQIILFIAAILIGMASLTMANIRAVSNGPVVGSEDAIHYILNGKLTTGDSDTFAINPQARTFDAKVVGTGAVTATVIIYVSNTGASNDWITAGTITLSGTTSDVDGFAMNAKWAYTKANVSAISGTGAAVTVTMGV